MLTIHSTIQSDEQQYVLNSYSIDDDVEMADAEEEEEEDEDESQVLDELGLGGECFNLVPSLDL